MGETTAARVAHQLHLKALEPVERLVRTLDAIKAPPRLAATVMEEMARIALEMAAHYRAKEPRP